MQKLIFNKENYSGDQVNIEFNELTGSFELNGYVFNLVKVNSRLIGEEYYEVFGSGWNGRLFEVFRFGSKAWQAFGNGTAREGNHPAEAAAKMILATIWKE
ncbi:MAG: hypothetical protein RIB01_15450 [Balneola sp.]